LFSVYYTIIYLSTVSKRDGTELVTNVEMYTPNKGIYGTFGISLETAAQRLFEL